MTSPAPAPALPPDRVLIGRLGAVHGLQGELRLFSLSDVPGRFEGLGEVWWLGARGPGRVLKVAGLRPTGKGPLIRFEGIASPEAAAPLVNGYLAVPAEARAAAPAGAYFVDELLGCEVVDEQGRRLGAIAEIFQTGANDIYAVRDGDRELLLPALRTVILEVDLSARRMKVRPPDGTTV
jgi:16S rRNA processing protein RimM